MSDKSEADQIAAINKIISIKDDILSQVFAAMTFKKTVIWCDLKIMPGSSKNADTNDEIYTSEKIAEAHEKIEEFEQRYGYLPTKLNYRQTDSEQQSSEEREKKGRED